MLVSVDLQDQLTPIWQAWPGGIDASTQRGEIAIQLTIIEGTQFDLYGESTTPPCRCLVALFYITTTPC